MGLDRLTKPATLTPSVHATNWRNIRTIRLTPVITRRGVVASHFERVFSWTLQMHRLRWTHTAGGGCSAQTPKWAMRIFYSEDDCGYRLEATRTVDGAQVTEVATSDYLQTCMDIAQAWAATR